MNWKTVNLGDVLQSIVGGGTPSKSKSDYWNGDIFWCSVKDMSDDKHYISQTEDTITKKGLDNSSTNLIKAGTVITSTRMGLGRAFINKIDMAINQDLKALISNEKIENRFLLWTILSKRNELNILGRGSTVKGITLGTLKNIKISLPPLATQYRIADILSTYDDLIDNNQKQIKLLEEAAMRLYKEWFVNLRFPGHETANTVDGVPEGWERAFIEDICQTVGGGTPSTKVPSYYSNGTIPWVTPTDITRNDCLVLLETEKKITEEGLAKSSAKMLPPETILMTSRASVGFFGVSEHKVCTNQGFISCIPYENDMMMYLLLNLMNRTDEIRQKAGGSTYLEINKATFRKFEILIPEVGILKNFQNTTYTMLERIRTLNKQIALLQEARDKLIPKLMNGEIEV